MEDQIKQLCENPFWRKKMYRELRIRDDDKDGFITRKDYELCVQRYKEFSGATDEQLKRIRGCLMQFCDAIGLTDDTKRMTYQEMMDIGAKFAVTTHDRSIFAVMFDTVDVDGDGVLSQTELTLQYKCMGIDSKYVKAAFEAMDGDGDGKLSQEEFVDCHAEYFYTSEDKLNSSVLLGPLDEV